MSIDLERVREYNKRCNSYKEKLSELSAERKIVSANLDNICKQLEKQLGREVTPQNIEEVYKAESLKVMNTLEAGESILKRIERAENGGLELESAESSMKEQTVGAGTTGNIGASTGAVGVGAVSGNANINENAGFNGFAGDIQHPKGMNPTTQNQSNGFEQSSYKIPNNFSSNPFARQSGFSGKFADFDAGDDDEEGIKIF